MADTKISALTASTTPLAGTEVLPIVQSGTTVKVSVANLTAGRAVTMLSNTMASASAVNDVDKTGGASYAYRVKGNDQSNVRFRFENTGGQIYELVGGNPGASNSGWAIYDATAGVTRVYLSSAGDVTVNTGNLVIGTSGKGIDFSATPGTGTSELLADYEEGTWTPTILGSTTAGTGTYTVQEASYTKVGRQVTVYGRVSITAHTGTGNILIGNLPFTIGLDYPTGSIRPDGLALTASNYPVLFGRIGNTTLSIQQGPVGGGSLTNVPMDTNCDMTFSIAYFV